MPNLLSFKWYKCPEGYEVLEFDPADLLENEDDDENRPWIMKPGAQSDTEELLNRRPAFEFMSGDEFIPRDKWICPKSEKLISFEISDLRSALFMEFATLDDSDASYEDFANEFGMLRFPFFRDEIQHGLWRGRPEQLSIWRRTNEELNSLIAAWRKALAEGSFESFCAMSRRSFGNVITELIPATGYGSMNLLLVPSTLGDALYLQLAQAVASNMQIKRCSVCPRWFAFGAGTGRRKSAHYCSDNCRKETWRRSQKVTQE